MPIKDSSKLGVIGQVRCPCGRVIAPALNLYHHFIQNGQTKKYALDHCGIPLHGPLNDKTAASECCRAYIMCTIDLTSTQLMYQEVANYAEHTRAKQDVQIPVKAESKST